MRSSEIKLCVRYRGKMTSIDTSTLTIRQRRTISYASRSSARAGPTDPPASVDDLERRAVLRPGAAVIHDALSALVVKAYGLDKAKADADVTASF